MAGGHDREEQVRAERARAIGLFRYGLIREAADPALSTKQRGRLVRELAGRAHPGPFGTPVRVARPTIDRWIRDWRRGGFDALVPNPRRVQPRTPGQVLELAAALKREVPARTAVQIAAILRAHSGWSPDERTLQRHFVRLELNTRPDGQPPRAFGRFEAEAPNVRWTGDALHGPVVGGRKAILFGFIDDHSRLVVGHRWGHLEDTVRLSAALRNALACRGIPQTVYLDNGAAMVDRQLATAGLRGPGHPAGPQPTRTTGRQRQDREVFPHRAGAVPGRDHPRPAAGRPDRVEHPVHRLGGDRVPPAGAHRDRADPDGSVVGDRHADPANPR